MLEIFKSKEKLVRAQRRKARTGRALIAGSTSILLIELTYHVIALTTENPPQSKQLQARTHR